MIRRKSFYSVCLFVYVLFLNAIGINATNLKIEIVDAETEKLTPARVLIVDTNGKSYFPENSVTLQIGNEIWFMSSGISEVNIDSENILLRVERGKEYERVKKAIAITRDQKNEIKIVLNRWINMKDRGYVSIENHIHRSTEDVAAMCAAEDLNFGTSLQWWNHPRFGVPSGDGHILDLNFGEIATQISMYDVEVEEKWGALYMLNMPNPFPFTNDKQMPNLIAVQYGRDRGTLNCYQSGWSREVLVDALLGYVDIVNVCNNNFHMHRYQPRSLYSNLLNVKGFPVYPNTPQGMMQMNTDTYYRLLNCGVKLAAGAGSATGAKENPVGFNRAYIRASPKDSLTGLLNKWKRGNNFVTNGPMLFLKTSKGFQPGDSINFNKGEKVLLEVEALSDSPLKKVEIIVNGEVKKSFLLDGNKKKFKGSFQIKIQESSWIAARCTDMDQLLNQQELEGYRSPRKNFYQDPNRLRYGHTSPIYVHIDNNGIAVKKSIEEGIKMVEAFEKFAKQNSSEQYLTVILDAIAKARNILNEKLK